MGKVGRNMVVKDVHPLVAIKTRSKRMDKTETGKTKQEEEERRKKKRKQKKKESQELERKRFMTVPQLYVPHACLSISLEDFQRWASKRRERLERQSIELMSRVLMCWVSD